MAWLSDLLVRLRAETADFQGDMGKAARVAESAMGQIQRAAQALGVALSAGGFVLAIKNSIDAADHLNDLSLTTKIAVEDLAGLNVAAKQSGSDLDSMADAVNKLAQNMGKTPEKFKALGVSAKEPLEAFKQFATVFKNIEDPQLRAAVAAQALGKSWAGAAPALAEGGQKLGEMIARGREYSGITKDITEQSDAFNDKLTLLVGTGGAWTRIMAPLLPMLNTLADDLLDAQKGVKGLSTEISPLLEVMKVMLILGSDVSFTFNTMGKDLARAAENVQLIATGQWAKSRELGRMFSEDAKRARAELEAWQKKIREMGTTKLPSADGSSTGDPAADARRAAAAAAAARAFIDKTNEAIQLQKRQAAAIQEMENKRKSLFGTTEAQLMQERLYGIQIDVGDGKLRHFKGTYEDFDKVVKVHLLTQAQEIDARNQLIQRIEAEGEAMRYRVEQREKDNALMVNSAAAMQREIADLGFSAGLLGKNALAVELLTAARQADIATQERIAARLANLPDDWDTAGRAEQIIAEEERKGDAQKKRIEEIIKKRQESERAWVTGAKGALQEYVDNATNAAEQARTLFGNAFKSMEDALVKFAQTGKLDFKSLADSIISDLIRIQVQKNVVGPLSKAFDDGDLFGKIGGFLWFGGKGGSYDPIADGLLGFAGGGQPPLGVASVVGERGPELFVPNQAGMVVPNGAGGGGGRRGGNTYIINAQGADAGAVARIERALISLAGPGRVERRAVAAVRETSRR